MEDEKSPCNRTDQALIRLDGRIRGPSGGYLALLAVRPAARMLAVDAINRWYAELLAASPQNAPFSRILTLRDISYQVQSEDLAKIPRHGPLVVVANHPFGGLEGIVLGDLMQRVRPDTKILGNYLLDHIAPIRDSIIPVDPFGRRSSVTANARTFRACLKWLRSGHCLITFPAGEVAHYDHRQRRVSDPPWRSHVAALIRLSGAQVLPIYLPGRNSLLFNLAGMIHPRLRTLLLGRELVARQGSRVRLFIGRPLAQARLNMCGGDQAVIDWLRFKTEFLANRSSRPRLAPPWWGKLPRPRPDQSPQPVVDPVNPRLLAAEIAALPEDQRLVQHKHMAVCVADSGQIPHLLREIGRLREKTFREVGEGTGRAMDLDLFDSTYRHLILWNEQTAEVVGAYRMGDTRDILARFGRKGLYTHSLFRFKPGLLRYLAHSLELGRSFIRAEYQRQPNCLALLWKGIGAYLVGHPGYRLLFGPVSISNSYHRVSKNIMVQFLQRRCTVKELAAHVSPRRPFRPYTDRSMPDTPPAESIDDVSMLVAEIEADGKRVPVLIKHYLKLNGQFIAFNVDRDFADAVDGLVIVDLMQTETKLLERFMGVAGCRSYRRQWTHASADACRPSA